MRILYDVKCLLWAFYVRYSLTASLSNKFCLKVNFSWKYTVIIVPKEFGTLRLCLDSRAINKVTKKEAYPTSKN